jgi:tight adherence protein C
MDQEVFIMLALAVGSLAMIVVLVFSGRKDQVAERLTHLWDENRDSSPASAEPPAPRAVPRLGASQSMRDAGQNDSRAHLRERIVQAGLYKPYALGLFTTLRVVLCVVPIGIGLFMHQAGMVPLAPALLYGILAGLFGTLAPTLWLDHLKRNRQTKVRRALPDALDVIVVCLEAGLSISSALSRVARELGGAHRLLALELGIVEREIQMGRTTGDAMRQFAQRFDMEELRSLAAVIKQAEQFGTSVVKAFNVYADSMRVRRHQRAEELAQKATIKILFPTLLCIFPGIFIVLLGPAAIRIYHVIILGTRNGTL